MKIKWSGEFHISPKRVTNQLEIFGEPAGKKETVAFIWLFWIVIKKRWEK
jgi:hypothetical protein